MTVTIRKFQPWEEKKEKGMPPKRWSFVMLEKKEGEERKAATGLAVCICGERKKKKK